MVDNFKAIYTILSTLEKAMDYPEFDESAIGPEALGVTKERWSRYIEIMADEGFINEVEIRHTILGGTTVHLMDSRITLKGLEYLQENSIMQRMRNTAKGITQLTS